MSQAAARTRPFWPFIGRRKREGGEISQDTHAPSLPIEEPQSSAPGTDFIDVKSLIADFDVSEHARRSNDYYRNFSLTDSQFRKPFMGFEAIQLTSKLSVILSNLDFFPGACVLDFGSGPGWLSQSLALMGCRVIAADVSRRALELGKAYTATKYPEVANQITYLAFKGFTIDLPSRSVDRVVCFELVPPRAQPRSGAQRVFSRADT